MKILLVCIIVIHGLIHIMGFANQWHLKKFENFTGITLFPVSEKLSKIFGLLWLLTAVIFTVSGVGLLLDKEWWAIAGITAVILSQFLILVYWRDAKIGTIPNVIILIAAVMAFASYSFNNKINEEASLMLSNSVKNDKTIVTAEMTETLPPVVKKWMKRTGIEGKEIIHTVRLKQKIQLRSKPDGDWTEANAVQYFRDDTPAFIYKLDINFGPLLSMTARDMYENSRGNMLIKLSGLYTVADSKSGEVNKSSMVRYLAETLWFPSCALSKYIKWEQIDSSSAKAVMNYGGLSESVLVRFTNEGDVKTIEAERYGEFDGKTSLEKWLVTITGYSEFEGIRIGNKAEVTWKLKTGDYTWLKLEITDLQYNKPFIY